MGGFLFCRLMRMYACHNGKSGVLDKSIVELVMMTDEKNDMSDALYLAAGYKTPKQADFEIRPLAEMERIYIETVIAFCEGSIPRAAEVLEVSPSTIYRKKSQWDDNQ